MGSEKARESIEVRPLGPSASMEIADVIEYVRAQLIESETRRLRDGLLPLFEVDRLDLELKMVLREAANSEGKLDLKLLALSSGDSAQSEQTHSVRLSLKAVDAAETKHPGGRVNGLRPGVKRREG